MTTQLVVLADAYEAMAQTRGHSVILTDPPYTEHVQDNMLSVVTPVEAGFDPLKGYDWLKGIVEATPRWSLFFCSLEQLGEYRAHARDHWVKSSIYAKTNPQPQMSKDRPGSKCEGVAVFHGPSKKSWNGDSGPGFWWGTPERRSVTQHPTGKPTMLCMRLVELFTNPGDIVFDPFAGTGAIGRACAVLDRQYIGCDNTPEYVRIANERIAEAKATSVDLLRKFAIYKEKYAKGQMQEEDKENE